MDIHAQHAHTHAHTCTHNIYIYIYTPECISAGFNDLISLPPPPAGMNSFALMCSGDGTPHAASYTYGACNQARWSPTRPTSFRRTAPLTGGQSKSTRATTLTHRSPQPRIRIRIRVWLQLDDTAEIASTPTDMRTRHSSVHPPRVQASR